ncbi:MAG TPA: amidohydrolase family protein [Candidatus Limnocylindria bacterium]|nr:amidohydrolase family protein [Candidatus Limnocylindria bacterium]
MADHATRIAGGDVLVRGQLVRADVLIDDGKIVAVVAPDVSAEAAETIDATGRVVLPGIIDTHAHTREPGYTHKEDFLTASQAAAAGGVTTMVDMPNVEPPTDTVERLLEKRELADRKSIIDWGHFAAGTKLEEIPRLAEAGATGFKVFQVSGEYPHDPRLAMNDEGQLLSAMRAVAETGLPLVIHPFNQSLFEKLTEEAFAAGKPNNWYTFGEVYTTEAIWHTAVNTLMNLQALTGARVHLVHTHSGGSLRLIREAKERGQRVSCSVDPKYYHLTRDDLMRLKGRACPGGFITEDADRMAEIWRSLRDGTIDSIDADHAPHTLEELDVMEEDAWHAAMGSPQYDWMYSITLTDVHAGHFSLARAVEMLAEAPARMLGLFPKKGAILPGSDADLVLVDLDREVTLSDEGLYTKVGWTPYLGRTIKGVVTMTMLRGCVIARDRQVIGTPGFGQYIAGVAQ